MIAVVPDATTRVLLALLVVEARGDFPDVRSVAHVARRSVAVTHKHLERLRDLDLVSWEYPKRGSLRSRVVARPV